MFSVLSLSVVFAVSLCSGISAARLHGLRQQRFHRVRRRLGEALRRLERTVKAQPTASAAAWVPLGCTASRQQRLIAFAVAL